MDGGCLSSEFRSNGISIAFPFLFSPVIQWSIFGKSRQSKVCSADFQSLSLYGFNGRGKMLFIEPDMISLSCPSTRALFCMAITRASSQILSSTLRFQQQKICRPFSSIQCYVTVFLGNDANSIPIIRLKEDPITLVNSVKLLQCSIDRAEMIPQFFLSFSKKLTSWLGKIKKQASIKQNPRKMKKKGRNIFLVGISDSRQSADGCLQVVGWNPTWRS